MKTKILTTILLSIGPIFASTALLAARTSDDALNSSNAISLPPAAIITTFDAPDAGTGSGQGTFSRKINEAGLICGQYFDASSAAHSFFRTADGAITEFDPAGAIGSIGLSINSAGAVAGIYIVLNNMIKTDHGFMRTLDGTITEFDAPGAGTGPFQGTYATNVNDVGLIAGDYADANYVYHGFVRATDGTFATFDAAGAGTGQGQGTMVRFCNGLDPAGAVTGFYIDANDVYHGYLRTANGVIRKFDVPGGGTDPGQGTWPFGISQLGITGFYIDANDVNHGFLRDRSRGTSVIFDVPGVGTGPGEGTIPASINARGVITGSYVDANDVNHAFQRARNGALATFDVSGAGTGPFQGTVPNSNNSTGAITGWYNDANGVYHGFLRSPN